VTPTGHFVTLTAATCDALAVLPVHVVVATGDIVDPAELSGPANAVTSPFASHEALMRRAALMVTCAIIGTTHSAAMSSRNGVMLSPQNIGRTVGG
jgi:UDP:flavonoid glycosyltransferase YjiC (YdhE family)